MLRGGTLSRSAPSRLRRRSREEWEWEICRGGREIWKRARWTPFALFAGDVPLTLAAEVAVAPGGSGHVWLTRRPNDVVVSPGGVVGVALLAAVTGCNCWAWQNASSAVSK